MRRLHWRLKIRLLIGRAWAQGCLLTMTSLGGESDDGKMLCSAAHCFLLRSRLSSLASTNFDNKRSCTR